MTLKHLYRYRDLRADGFEWFRKGAAASELFFPLYPELNDPFDGKIWPTGDGTLAEKRELMVDYLTDGGKALDDDDEAEIAAFLALPVEAQRARIRTAHEIQAGRIGVTCFSETGDDIPMWAYYGAAHKGLCLQFDSIRLIGMDGCTPPIRVRYAKEYPRVPFFTASRFRRMAALVDTKSKAWKHESEWRIVRTAGRGASKLPPAALTGILLGCQIEPDVEAKVREVHSQLHGVRLLRTYPIDGEFRLGIRPA